MPVSPLQNVSDIYAIFFPDVFSGLNFSNWKSVQTSANSCVNGLMLSQPQQKPAIKISASVTIPEDVFNARCRWNFEVLSE